VSGRTAVVTGGASGIGAGISQRLARDGVAVAVFDLNGAGAQEIAASIADGGGDAIGLTVDVTDRAAIDAAADEVRSRLGRPTILVNCAGRSAWGDFLEITADQWRQAIAVNLTAAFYCCQVFIPDMLAEGWGRIINISSSSVHVGVPRLAPYVTAKMGMVGLTKSLAVEFAREGITVNTIPPGSIDTPMTYRDASLGFLSFEESLKRIPVGRRGRPEDVAAACAFLVSDESSYVTGQILPVNGGRQTTEP
jgi:NAD(P)-dependent dehydrogenase (short-subunit alcohol dehydrogenase family)